MHFNRGDLAAIAAGGVAGASLRWLVTRETGTDGGWFAYSPGTSFGVELTFPWQTLLVNVLGCLALGALTVLLVRAQPARPRLLLASATGFCGSLTTFSTFAVDVAERLRSYERGQGMAYLLASVLAGALAFWLGRLVMQRIVTSPGDVTIGGAP